MSIAEKAARLHHSDRTISSLKKSAVSKIKEEFIDEVYVQKPRAEKKKSEYYKANQEQFAEKKAVYYAANKEKIYAYGKEYYANNKGVMLNKHAQYREQNKEQLSVKDAEAYRRNEGKYRAHTMNLAASKINRKPAWLTEFDHTYIQCLHQLAAMRSRESGEQWEVDHIIPLRGKLVSGLHVPSNLQVITAKANQQKTNSYTVN
jgi:5-methylcytosine-specific restriction endonuclease McrA